MRRCFRGAGPFFVAGGLGGGCDVRDEGGEAGLKSLRGWNVEEEEDFGFFREADARWGC